MKQPPSYGVCQLCQRQFTKSTVSRHLQRCLPEHEPARGKEKKLLHLSIDGGGPYWLQVEMPADAKFADLDHFLRHIWLECCGHLSIFRLEREKMRRLGLDTEPQWDLDMELPEEPLMDYEVGEVLEPKEALGYEYDMGSTTELRLRVAGIRVGRWAGKERIRLLARNLPPEIACDCGKPAECIDVETDSALCAACAAEVGDDESFLPVVNSPRMGVCGYTGEESR